MASTTTTESEWNDEERGWALALELVESRACSGCGSPQSRVWGEDKPVTVEVLPFVCVDCLQIANTHGNYLKQRKGFPAQALKITTRPRRAD